MSKEEERTGKESDAYPDLHVGPLAEPLLSRFGGGELGHLFPVELQDAGVFVPHHLQQIYSRLIQPAE